MTQLPNSLEARDVAVQLHSYADARKQEETGSLVIDKGEGIYVTDINGKRYIEGMAGLWSVAVGFGEKRLVDAAARQMEKLPYYHTFTYKTHGPSIELAEKMIEMAPVPMSKVYFTNSGSEANDTALKLIWYRSNALGQPERKKVISRVRGYHGVTIASASLTGLPNNHRSFDLPLPQVLHTTSPHYRSQKKDGEGEAALRAWCARQSRSHNAMQAVFRTRNRVAGISLQELRDVVDIWVDAAMRLAPSDLKKMERLAAAQDRRCNIAREQDALIAAE